MFITLFTITTSAAVTTWIVFSLVIYLWHYFIEVVLDLPIIGQSPCSAHASLKLLIQKLIQEAIGLPTLQKAQEHPGAPAENTNRTYEDLLATAILNKVIQNYQEELPTSSANSVSSRLSSSSRHNGKEYFFGEETLDTKWKDGSAAADVDTTSVSSLEEWVRSDSSVGSTKFVDHMSLTIQQRIEEVSSSEDEADITEPINKGATLVVENEGWEENWSLQKRKFGGTASPVPVPMLVPNPMSEAKVLIGDRDAEDTTDLSDAGSDFGDVEVVQGRESILVESKTVIGGKNLLVNVSVEEKDISEDGSTDDADIVEEKERVMEQFTSMEQTTDETEIPETFNTSVIDKTEFDPEQEDTSPMSFDSHTEQDTEYTEKYATLPRTILKTPTPQSRDLKNITEAFPPKEEAVFEPIKNLETEIKIEQNGLHQNGLHENGHHDASFSDEDEDVQREKFKGSYSERDKDKWNHAVEMKNNPYSPENLTRRLSTQSSNSSTSAFGREYYIREASKSAGARKTPTSDGEDNVVFQQVKSEFQSNNEDTKKEVASPTANSNASVYKAVPVVIDTDTESLIEVISPTRPTPNVLEISSDSDYSIERVYNLNSGKVYENNHREIIAASKNPIGQLATDIDKDKITVDENHNNTSVIRKRDFFKSLTESETSVSPTSPTTHDSVFNDDQTNLEIPQVPSIKPPPVVSEQFIKEEIIAISNENSFDNKEFSLEYSTDEFKSINTSKATSLESNKDPEIHDLKDKHLVKDRLGIFSKSYPNLAAVPLTKGGTMKKEFVPELQDDRRYSSEVSPTLVRILDKSFGDLKKKFDNADPQIKKEEIPKKEVHSLTARSLSREFRQELKGKENGIESEPHLKSTITTHEESEEPKAFPNAKSRIQFFENLNR